MVFFYDEYQQKGLEPWNEPIPLHSIFIHQNSTLSVSDKVNSIMLQY